MRKVVSKTNYRVGQIVPSSNTTMETEIPGRGCHCRFCLRADAIAELGTDVRGSHGSAGGVFVPVSTTFMMLKNLGLKTVVPNAGALLSGKY